MSAPVDDAEEEDDLAVLWDDAPLSAPPEDLSVGDFEPDPCLSSPDPHAFATGEDGRYRRTAILGAGGMGRVWSVHDQRLQRAVALKELPPEASASSTMRDRLAREAWITAQLEHPHIVPVYDAGQAPDGTLFYAMRMVRGRSLHEALEATPALTDRLRLLRHFLDVCEAVAYAHSLGIVHRDLKPHNVMIGEFGETQLVDWGLARPVDTTDTPWAEAVSANAELTRVGAVVGTPAYMSPEQARGQPATEASDIWSLGAILYTLITGSAPWPGATDEVLAVLRTDPGSRLPVRTRCPQAPPELAMVAERALSAEPATRYGSASALAADISAWLDGRRVEAYAYSRWELLRRFVAAWRVPIAVGALALVVLAVVGLVAYRRVVDEKTRAARAEAATRDSLEQSDRHLAAALLEQSMTLAALEARPEAEILAAHALAFHDAPDARGVLATFGATEPPRRIERLEAEALPPCEHRVVSSRGESLLCLEGDAVSLWRLPGLALRWRSPLRVIGGGAVVDGAPLLVVHVSPDEDAVLDAATGEVVERYPRESNPKAFLTFGHHAITSSAPPSVTVVDLERGIRVERALCDTPAYEPAVALDARARRLVSYCSDDLTLRIYALDDGLELERRSLPIDGGLSVLALSPDGSLLAGGNTHGEVVLFDLSGAGITRRATTDAGVIASVAFTPDGRQIVVAGERGGVRVWHVASGAWTGRLPRRSGRRVAVGPGAGELTVMSEASLERWRLPDAPRPHVLLAGEDPPVGLASATLSPDGAHLVAHRGDGSMVVVDTGDGRVVARVDVAPGQSAPIKHGAYSEDGRHYRPISAGHETAVFDTSTWRAVPGVEPTRPGRRIERLRGAVVGIVGYGAERSGVLAEGAPWSSAQGFDTGIVDLGVAPDRRVAVALTEDPPQQLWRLALDPSGAWTHTQLLEVGEATAVDIAADGALAIAGGDRVRLVASGAALSDARALVADPGTVLLDVALAPDGARVAASDLAGHLWVWSTRDGRLLARLQGHTARVPWLELDASGETLFSASWDGTVWRWDLSRLEQPASELIDALEQTWGLSRAEAIGRPL